MWRRPLLEVRNGSGKDVLPGLEGLWISVQTTDKAGKESDEAKIVTIGPPSKLALPKRGDPFDILMGWADEGLVLQGRFTFQKAQAIGTPERGHTLVLTFRAADFVDKLKGQGREHYDDTTFGDLMEQIAGKAGLQAQVDPALAKIKLGYRVRWDQSLIDFGTEIAEELGATLKPAGGKLVAMKRGGGKSGSGQALEPILIQFDEDFGYEIDIEPRPEAGKVAAAWQDGKSGERKLKSKATGRDGPTKILAHPFRSEEDAEEAAEAEGYESDNASGSGHFETVGLPRARAEAPVIASGYGPLIDGKWKAETVEKTVTSKGGFLTTVRVTAGTDKKGEKGK